MRGDLRILSWPATVAAAEPIAYTAAGRAAFTATTITHTAATLAQVAPALVAAATLAQVAPALVAAATASSKATSRVRETRSLL